MNILKDELPQPLQKYSEVIKSSVKQYIKITGTKQKNNFWDSKFGGEPYFPTTLAYPLDTKNKPMRLLAQINFTEIPECKLLPKKGILQFFISVEDDIYGLNCEDGTRQANYRIIYHEEICLDSSKLITDFSFLQNITNNNVDFPIQNEVRLHFQKKLEPVSSHDYQFKEYLGQTPSQFFDTLNEDIEDFYIDNFSGIGHKLGGYAFFTQCDPREYKKEYRNYDILLLQIDTDEHLDIIWGDSGVANFFITKKDLDKLDFSNVLYNWDCM